MSALPQSRTRPVELNEPEWLAWRYQRDGDAAIALELGVSKKTVTLARARHGIESRPPGRPRGSRIGPVSAAPSTSAAQIVARIGEQSLPGGPAPSFDLLLGRLVEVDRAHRAGERAAVLDGLIEVAAAAGLVHAHLERLGRRHGFGSD